MQFSQWPHAKPFVLYPLVIGTTVLTGSNQHKIGSWLKLTGSLSVPAQMYLGWKPIVWKVKGLSLFLTVCPMPAFPNSQERACACYSEQDKDDDAVCLSLEIHTTLRFSFEFTALPTFRGKPLYWSIKSFRSCKIPAILCVTLSFHLEKGSEIPVTQYSERKSFPNKFLCVENKRERKEYALADIAVFKKAALAMCNTAEL